VQLHLETVTLSDVYVTGCYVLSVIKTAIKRHVHIRITWPLIGGPLNPPKLNSVLGFFWVATSVLDMFGVFFTHKTDSQAWMLPEVTNVAPKHLRGKSWTRAKAMMDHTVLNKVY
jgi:hypothetical protein